MRYSELLRHVKSIQSSLEKFNFNIPDDEFAGHLGIASVGNDLSRALDSFDDYTPDERAHALRIIVALLHTALLLFTDELGQALIEEDADYRLDEDFVDSPEVEKIFHDETTKLIQAFIAAYKVLKQRMGALYDEAEGKESNPPSSGRDSG